MTYYTILDFETTGLDYLQEQIIEIGAIKVDSELKEVGRIHTMVKLTRGRKLPEFITRLTGITEQDTLSGTSEVTALNMVKEFIGDSIVVAQHAPFDMAFLSKVVEPKKFIDTRSLSRILRPHEKAGLKDICARYEINLEGHHRSINDCEATLQALKHMFEELDTMTTPSWMFGIGILNVVVEASDRPLTFIPKHSKVIGLEQLQQ